MFATGLAMATGLIDNQELDIHSPSFEEAVTLLQGSVETAVSKGPLRVSITIEGETSTFTITLDDDMKSSISTEGFDLKPLPRNPDLPRFDKRNIIFLTHKSTRHC